MSQQFSAHTAILVKNEYILSIAGEEWDNFLNKLTAILADVDEESTPDDIEEYQHDALSTLQWDGDPFEQMNLIDDSKKQLEARDALALFERKVKQETGLQIYYKEFSDASDTQIYPSYDGWEEPFEPEPIQFVFSFDDVYKPVPKLKELFESENAREFGYGVQA